jgi:hypothetical protein
VSGFISVSYPTDRRVFANGVVVGRTNEVLEVGAGPFRIDLGSPANYEPSFRKVVNAGPFDVPVIVTFTVKVVP